MPRGTARAVANAVRAVTTVGVVRPLRILLSATPLAKAKTPITKEIAPVTNSGCHAGGRCAMPHPRRVRLDRHRDRLRVGQHRDERVASERDEQHRRCQRHDGGTGPPWPCVDQWCVPSLRA